MNRLRHDRTRFGAYTVDEGVQDGHGTVGDTSVGVDLLEDWNDASV